MAGPKKGSVAHGTFGQPLVKASYTMGQWSAKPVASVALAGGEA